ncbi:MAG: hypothetical protein ABSG48_06555, partial [Geobacteraceae bacterium]
HQFPLALFPAAAVVILRSKYSAGKYGVEKRYGVKAQHFTNLGLFTFCLLLSPDPYNSPLVNKQTAILFSCIMRQLPGIYYTFIILCQRKTGKKSMGYSLRGGG